jgi:hypothetical protein
LFGRAAMMIATTVILPVALRMGSRGVNTVDEIAKEIDVMRARRLRNRADIRSLRQPISASRKWWA